MTLYGTTQLPFGTTPFTPSLLDPAVLEALFVQREDLALRLETLVLESARGDSKHHQLVVGGPGLGKTHLLALVYHRIRIKQEEGLRIAWLGEDLWGISSFLDLLLRILETLPQAEPLEGLFDLHPDEAERAAGERLQTALDGQTLLLMVEDLQDLFDNLGQEGQEKMRAFLQENPCITILASAQYLFPGVSRRTSPFYGTFSIDHLEALNQDQARSLLAKTALLRGDQELADYLRGPSGERPVRAIMHLARGNHRLLALFTRHLTGTDPERLSMPLLATLDDLTPYCRDWLESLPAQPRKILHLLCRLGAATTVKEIARRCFLKHQNASSQLKLLRDRGYVRAHALGRDAYYEVSDRLMRLCTRLKDGQPEGPKELVCFLKYWFAMTDQEKVVADGVSNILLQSPSPETWFQRAETLVEEMQAEACLDLLPVGLVRSVLALKRSIVSKEGARIWLGVWKANLESRPGFALSLRLLERAVRYLEDPGPRVLLGLAVEEREILAPLLETDKF